MADPADSARPSSAPLSVEDADRIADGFTAIWEDPPTPAVAEAAPAPTPHPHTVTAPMPAVVLPVSTAPAEAAVSTAPAAKVGKQTLIGIAPINIEKPPEKPLEKPPPSDPHPSAPIRSSPEVPGYAIAYTPKDPPSTPAVVIAPEAQSSPENAPPEDRRRFSQTVPSMRSAPNASLAPPPVSVPPLAPLPALPPVDDFNPYAAKKGKGKVVGLSLGGGALLLVGVFGVRALSGGDRNVPVSSTQRSEAASDVVRATTVVAPTPTSAPSEPAVHAPTTASRSAAEPEATPIAARTANEKAPAKANAKTKVKVESAAAPRPLNRPTASEPSPQPSKPAAAGKGVIVRDAPF